MKITFGLVVYNEEKNIRRCLESIKDVADEIVVVHDGECKDNTLKICGEYTDKIFVREHLGGSDPHRLFILKQARNDWIFIIDADEFLSEELKLFLADPDIGEKCAGVAFKWPYWDGKKYGGSSNYRVCLMNRNKCWAISLHNFPIRVLGPVCKVDCLLEHRPEENRLSLSHAWSDKIKKRIPRDANRFLLGFDNLEKYNPGLIDEKFKNWFSSYLAHPLYYAFLNLFKYFLGSYKNVYKDGVSGLIISLQQSLYQFKLALTIWKIKRNGKKVGTFSGI